MDQKRIADIHRQLNVVPLLDYLDNYRQNWTIHLHRMARNRIPKEMKNYRSNGKRYLGRSNKTCNETKRAPRLNTCKEEEANSTTHFIRIVSYS